MNVDENDLLKVFKNITSLEMLLLREVKLSSKANSALYALDLYYAAIINRSISLMRGYLTLANENNYITAVPIIRMQIDNCLRFYASTIVSNPAEFFTDYLSGIHIRNIKDSSGNKMTDKYLIDKLDNTFPGIKNLYENTSGYIHLSNEHAFLQTETVNDEERRIRTIIGFYDFFTIDEKVDFSFNMFMAGKFLLDSVCAWRKEKLKQNT